jgi:putative MFS transporter
MEYKHTSNPFNAIVIVAALGYFVDIYDLLLFSVERVDSLSEILNVPKNDPSIKNEGLKLLNWQMFGMLVGGIIWGIIADKKGRLSVLFGSIITYSNIANGFVQDVNTYAILRFISGFGLAGELGAGITLVSETMTKEKRTIGTMIVATVGVFGAVVAGFMSDVISNWRYSFFVGGGMGLLLLLLRIGVYESGMFKLTKESNVKRGTFLSLFNNKRRATQYLSIIFVTVPVWYVIGILITLAPELISTINPSVRPDPGKSIMFAYIGITAGDFLSGYISHVFKSRKKALGLFLTLTAISVVLYFNFAANSLFAFYAIDIFLGIATGYWAVFMSTASELFGTNIRGTATTTAPNFVRASLILSSFMFKTFESMLLTDNGKPNSIKAAAIVGVIIIAIAYVAWFKLEETSGKDLNYMETI